MYSMHYSNLVLCRFLITKYPYLLPESKAGEIEEGALLVGGPLVRDAIGGAHGREERIRL
jgi:hypothetical protein